MKNEVLETEYIDTNSKGIVRVMFDGKKITIGKNVEDFYEKLINLPTSYKCQLMNLDINELSKYIKESQNYYNEKLISLFKKKWIWRIDGEIYNFSDREINKEFFDLLLDKKQIISKLNRNTFSTNEIFDMLNFFENNEDIIEQYEE
jgi:hypothetical protein